MSDPDTIGFLLTDVARILRTEFEKRIADAGLDLTPGEARALLRVWVCSGERQNVIAEKMGIEPMTLSTYLDRLETLGLIERIPDPADRRAKNIVPTERAKSTAKAIRKISGSVLDLLQTGLGDDEREALRGALKVMRGNAALLSDDDVAV